MMLADRIKNDISAHLKDYQDIVLDLYENPEIGNEEVRSQKVLTEYLSERGFEISKSLATPTDFTAKYSSLKPGPVIAFLCEYDALPGIGHGCGHNLIAGLGIASGCALKSVIDETGGTVIVIGTPAEENFGGKVSMAEAGIFDNVDAALMLHPSSVNSLGGSSSALYPLKFTFHGKTAHGCRAYQGNSALDAAVLTYQGISMLRQFADPSMNPYIHGIIKDGGKAANVIPDLSVMEYYFRADTIKYAKELSQKAVRIAEGSCLQTGCTFETEVYECPYEDTIINFTLADALKESFIKCGIEDVEGVNLKAQGSTDVGAVSYRCPVIQGYIKIADRSVPGHSTGFADATVSDEGNRALEQGAAVLADLGLELILNKELLEKVRKEHEKALADARH